MDSLTSSMRPVDWEKEPGLTYDLILLRNDGRKLNVEEYREMPRVKGLLVIADEQDPAYSSRTLRVARFKQRVGAVFSDVCPKLYDPVVIGADLKGLQLQGWEWGTVGDRTGKVKRIQLVQIWLLRPCPE